MSMYLLAAATALWFGIWTSFTPCPLASNIAAISFVGSRVGRPLNVFLAGLLYTVGRVVVYTVLGVVIVAGLTSDAAVSNFLQKYMNKILGPVLILVGMLLLELIQFSVPGVISAEKIQAHAEKCGVWGAGVLGIVFALSFCPISAGLFFLYLIPLAVKHESIILFPSLYGIGTGLPVFGFAILVAIGTQWLGGAYSKLTRVEWWVRHVTGVLIILVGIYYCLAHIFGVFS